MSQRSAPGGAPDGSQPPLPQTLLGFAPYTSGAHVPDAHVRQVPAHPVLQHTPSTQFPLRQSAPRLHV